MSVRTCVCDMTNEVPGATHSSARAKKSRGVLRWCTKAKRSHSLHMSLMLKYNWIKILLYLYARNVQSLKVFFFLTMR